MLYAKIDEQGNVIEFPYRDVDRQAEIPADAVIVDSNTNRPENEWELKLFYDGVFQSSDGSYVLNYRQEPRFSTFEGKAGRFRDMVNQKISRNKSVFENAAKNLNNTYPYSEQESWSIQRQEALRYTEDNTYVPPLLSVVSQTRGITVAEMVTKVMENVDLYNQQYGQILGQYQKNRALLNSITYEDDSTWGIYYTVEV